MKYIRQNIEELKAILKFYIVFGTPALVEDTKKEILRQEQILKELEELIS